MIWVVLGLWALGFALLWRVPRCPGAPFEGTPARVSLVVPARNEEANLRRLLASTDAQTLPFHEVIVVDDASTDRTADVAREGGAAVHSAPPLPEGWRGKAWACQHGARVSTGDALLFLDADTTLRSNAHERIQSAYAAGERGAVSLGPYHDVERPYEELSAIFNLMTFMGLGAFSAFGSPDDPRGLFGPFLLIDRDAYEGVGGHEAVRGEILEHMTLCGLLRERGVRMWCGGGRGVVHTRMYPDGLASLIEGWTKAFAAGASKTETGTLVMTVLWMTGGMLAFLLTALSPWISFLSPWFPLTYVAYAVSVYAMLRRIGRFSVWSSALYPLLMVAFFVIFFRSALLRRTGGQVTWKDRSIDAGQTS
ncbi:MAG: glycosyltransferase family 2 protein [Planctomycetota bacterium]